MTFHLFLHPLTWMMFSRATVLFKDSTCSGSFISCLTLHTRLAALHMSTVVPLQKNSTDLALVFEMLQRPSTSVLPNVPWHSWSPTSKSLSSPQHLGCQQRKLTVTYATGYKPAFAHANTWTHLAEDRTEGLHEMPTLSGEMFGYHSCYLTESALWYIRVAYPSEILIPGEWAL